MAHYYARECYTPDDPNNGNRRWLYAEFDSTSTDPVQVAAEAMHALRPGVTVEEAVRRLKANNADEELSEQELTSDDPEENTLEFMLMGNDGQYDILLSQDPMTVRRPHIYVYMCNGQPIAVRDYESEQIIAELAAKHRLPAASIHAVRVEDLS